MKIAVSFFVLFVFHIVTVHAFNVTNTTSSSTGEFVPDPKGDWVVVGAIIGGVVGGIFLITFFCWLHSNWYEVKHNVTYTVTGWCLTRAQRMDRDAEANTRLYEYRDQLKRQERYNEMNRIDMEQRRQQLTRDALVEFAASDPNTFPPELLPPDAFVQYTALQQKNASSIPAPTPMQHVSSPPAPPAPPSPQARLVAPRTLPPLNLKANAIPPV